MRNFDTGMVLKPLLHNTLDFNFYYYILSILIGIFLIYKLIRFYFEFHSIDYLLFSLFIFGTVVNLFLWHLFDEYFSNLSSLLVLGDFPSWIQASALELALAGRLISWIGMLSLFIFVIRLKHWKSNNTIEKIVIVVLLIDQLIRIILDFFVWLFMALGIFDFKVLLDLTFGTGSAYIGTVYGVFEFFNIPFARLAYPLYLIYFFLIYNLITSSIAGKSRSIIISRIFWMFFGTISILLVVIEESIGFSDSGIITRGVFSLIQLLFLIAIIIILYYGPELILITDKLLFEAKKLYEVIDSAKVSEKSNFKNFPLRIKSYVDSIPEDTLKEISSLNRL